MDFNLIGFSIFYVLNEKSVLVLDDRVGLRLEFWVYVFKKKKIMNVVNRVDLVFINYKYN